MAVPELSGDKELGAAQAVNVGMPLVVRPLALEKNYESAGFS